MLTESELWDGLNLFYSVVFPLDFFDQVKKTHTSFTEAINELDFCIERSLEELFVLERQLQDLWDKIFFFKFKVNQADLDEMWEVHNQRCQCYLIIEDLIRLKQKAQDKHFFLTELICQYHH